MVPCRVLRARQAPHRPPLVRSHATLATARRRFRTRLVQYCARRAVKYAPRVIITPAAAPRSRVTVRPVLRGSTVRARAMRPRAPPVLPGTIQRKMVQWVAPNVAWANISRNHSSRGASPARMAVTRLGLLRPSARRAMRASLLGRRAQSTAKPVRRVVTRAIWRQCCVSSAMLRTARRVNNTQAVAAPYLEYARNAQRGNSRQ